MTDTSSDAQAIVNITRDATRVAPVAGHNLIVLTDRDGEQRIVDLEQYEEAPRRTARTVTVWDAAAFLDYVGKHGRTPDTLEVWADVEQRTVTAIFDSPGTDWETTGWCGHRCTLNLRLSPAWKTWTAASGQLNPQTVFAEVIEDNLPDIVRPTGAEMLELAQTFQATAKVDFKAHRFLDNGMRALEYAESAEAKSGKRGQIEIPSTFDLALKPFLGSEPYRVTARLRWRITDGDLRIGYKLDRPDEVLRAAFDDVLMVIGEALPEPVRVNDGRP